MIAVRRDFTDRHALAAAFAHDVARQLSSVISQKGHALLAVSGGSTPALFFERLRSEPVDWPRVTVTLVDERCVPETSTRSNARLVKDHLLGNDGATFVPLFENKEAAARLGPFDVVVLGMGNDGHTASFFPGGDRLADALDLNGKARVIPMVAPEAGEPRLTFTLPALLEALFIALHIEGEDKARVLNKAMQPGPVEAMPIRAFLEAPAPLNIYWSP